jgi:hypothetical protein
MFPLGDRLAAAANAFNFPIESNVRRVSLFLLRNFDGRRGNGRRGFPRGAMVRATQHRRCCAQCSYEYEDHPRA